MDKSVLLVLLCLQVFLLITAFTSTDAAALALTDPQPPDLVEKRNDRKREIFGNRRKRYLDSDMRDAYWDFMGVKDDRPSRTPPLCPPGLPGPGLPGPPPPRRCQMEDTMEW